MAHLILARHGNTFESGETPYWVGAKTDLPLTQEGERQAFALANMIEKEFLPISALMAGPLKRTTRGAELIASKAGMGFTVDERLLEIDYGLWEGKSSDQIRAEFGDTLLEAWEKDGIWPDDMNWLPTKDKIEMHIKNFLAEQMKNLQERPTKNRVAVTSNGILRFFYRAITGLNPDKDAKVKTGHYCVLSPENGTWKIEAWNVKPE